MYIYEDHIGGLYTSNRALSYEERHCEQCGDTDWLVGYASSRAEAWELLGDDWSNEYLVSFIEANCEE